MAVNKHLKLAGFQGKTRNGDVNSNLKLMLNEMKNAFLSGAELIVFPELFLSGYCLPAEQMRSVAEEKDGPSFQELSEAAKQWSIAVLYGYPELDRSSGEDVLYNSAQLIDKDGSSLSNYRKTHLWIDKDGYERVFRAGEALEEVVECCGVKLGILICFDMEFPECVRALALKGAQLIAVPTAISSKLPLDVRTKVPSLVVPTRAMENGVYFVSVNHAGEEFNGHSICCSPNGKNVGLTVGTLVQLVLYNIDTAVKLKVDYLSERRTDVYDGVVIK